MQHGECWGGGGRDREAVKHRLILASCRNTCIAVFPSTDDGVSYDWCEWLWSWSVLPLSPGPCSTPHLCSVALFFFVILTKRTHFHPSIDMCIYFPGYNK